MVDQADTHFDIQKFQLVHYKYAETPLQVGTHIIRPSKSAKYLGIEMDRQLRWKPQVERAAAVGTKTILAIYILTH
jgi:hypothetical protein